MADARTAILVTLDPAHEGGFQKNPKDRANWTSGIVGVGTLVGTNGGITALDMPGKDIEHLTTEDKVAYYIENYWKPYYSYIASQEIANKLFDLGVLFGVKTAVRELQETLKIPVIDGVFGPSTLIWVNDADQSALLTEFKAAMTARAVAIAAENPDDAPDLPDWKRRIAL